MGVWYKPQEWFKKFRRKKDLREVCREKYGDDFVEMYDMVNNGNYFKDADGYEMCDNSEGYDHVTEDGFCAWAKKREES